MRLSEKIVDYLLSIMQNANMTELRGKYASYAYISKTIGEDKKNVQAVFDMLSTFGLLEKQVVSVNWMDEYKIGNIFKFNDLGKICFHLKTLPSLTKKEFAVLEQIYYNPYWLQREIAVKLDITENNANVHTCKLRKKGYLTSNNRLERGIDLNIVRFLTYKQKTSKDVRHNK